MAYNTYYPSSYQYSQFLTQPQPQPQTPASEIKWVQGEAGAKSYLVAPNQTVTLWDTESQTIYVKSADASGMPSMKVLDYTLREDMAHAAKIPPQSGYATKDDLNYIKEEIDALKAKFEEVSK